MASEDKTIIVQEAIDHTKAIKSVSNAINTWSTALWFQAALFTIGITNPSGFNTVWTTLFWPYYLGTFFLHHIH